MKEVKFELWSQKGALGCPVMDGCMMFCDIVSQMGWAWAPILAELAFSCLELEPVELHIHGLESFARNVVGYYSQSCCVICLHRCGGLFVSHFPKGMLCRDGLMAIDEEGT